MRSFDTISTFVLNTLPYNRSDAKIFESLQAKPAAELLSIYLNWHSRLISRRPRRVLKSSQVRERSSVNDYPAILSSIIFDIEQGNDLRKYLSKRISEGYSLPERKKKNLTALKHLDTLLNDWGIHHLHFSNRIDDDGFTKRGDPLLFVIFTYDTAYLLNIGSHSSFADDVLAQIAITNWPEDNLFLCPKDISPGRNSSMTIEERKKLRAAGIASSIDYDGRVFFPRAPITTAGISVKIDFLCMQIMRNISKYEYLIINDESLLTGPMRMHVIEPPNDMRLGFFTDGDRYGFIEENTKFFLIIGRTNL